MEGLECTRFRSIIKDSVSDMIITGPLIINIEEVGYITLKLMKGSSIEDLA